MIGSEFYRGQGFGNQLWVYMVIRAIAERKNYDFGFASKENFKGKDFLNLDLGCDIKGRKSKGPNDQLPYGFSHYQTEKKVFLEGTNWDVTPFDPLIYDLPDSTFIDGYFQSERYLTNFKQKAQSMLRLPGDSEDICTIHFRAGDYVQIKDVFLPPKYYYDAINAIKSKSPNVNFRVVTDGPRLASKIFPGFEIVSSGHVTVLLNKYYFQQKSSTIGKDFSLIQKSRYLILSNSSYSWWGAWSNSAAEMVIAPKYWARFNSSNGYWGLGDSLTKGWLYLDKFGELFTYEDCVTELEKYRKK